MAKRLTLAQKHSLGEQAYEMSLKGCSDRAISRQLGISHHTVRSLIRQQAEQRRGEDPDNLRQRRLDSISRLMQRIWEELDRDPSPHATAELSRAWNGLIAEMNKLDGLYAPQKVDARVSVQLQQESYIHHLGDAPLVAVSHILEAASRGEDGEDALAEVVQRYQEGTLGGDLQSPELLELEEGE